MTSASPGAHYLETVAFEMRRLKALAEKSIAQAGDDDLERRLDAESNSIGILVRHLAGNMRSRWTDFLTTDGEKPTRNRDAEFDTRKKMSRHELLETWEAGWDRVFSALAPLRETDLLERVRVRGEELSVLEAINRQLSHYAYHVGQITFLAKHLAGGAWRSLSIPTGESDKAWRYRGEGR
jgi:uncharacterized damage-inducible protein DinB